MTFRFPSILLLVFSVLFVPKVSSARVSATPADSSDAVISGFVRDSATGETLIGATVRVRALKRGAVTNKSGFFALHLPAGVKHFVEITSLGYRTWARDITLTPGETRQMDFRLAAANIQSEEITVESDRERDRQAPQLSRVNIQPQQVASLPKAGEADLFRTLQLLPGVKTASEISSGLYIRGGSPDQNLILLDGSVLYNPSHFFGFFSTFNSDAIKDVELIKGGYPVEYGGRLSAVLSVTNKDGDLNNTHGKFSLGLISSRATLETPLGDGAISISGRRTYLDAILKVSGLQEELDLPNYKFYDLNGKITQTLSPNDKIAVSGYYGADDLNFEGEQAASSVQIGWGNQSGSVSWTHLLKSDLFTKFNLTASRYYSDLILGSGSDQFARTNDIYDYSLRGDLEYFLGQEHKLKTGLQASLYKFLFKVQSGTNPPGANLDLRPQYYAGYLQDEWTASEDIAIVGGVRADGMTSRSEIYVDPRIAVRYNFSPLITLKASAGIYHQYLRLAANPVISFFDVWLPIDTTQPAARAEQYILGVSTVPWEGYTLEIETYYKNMTNLVELKPNIISGGRLDEIFFLGNGRAYGIEFFLQKQIGDLYGWIGYTLAWTKRTFPEINDGEEFPPTYDRRNDVNFVATYKVNDRWTLGATFVYGSGQAYTQTKAVYPVESYDYKGQYVSVEGKTNALRLPQYHRLDLSATYSFSFFSEARNASLNIDIYNAYNYRNVWFRQVNSSTNPATIEDIRLLPILPTLGLQVSF